MTPEATLRKPTRSGSRHKPRSTISFKPSVYEALAQRAEENGRPISWEAERIVVEALRLSGHLPADAR